MLKIVFLFALVSCACAEDNATSSEVPGNRQKRAMLFFDDDGHLMKSFVSPYLQQLAKYAASRPEHENFLKYFFDFLRPLIINTATAAYMIPVSENVVQQINRDPIYQNRFTISKRGPEFNPLCAGRRTQIPAPSACNSFLSCWDGWAYELQCPEGLMFSSEGYCDYADMVQCHDRSVAVPNPLMPRCKTDFETFRNEMNCNEFFVCVNRKPVKFQCPADLAYSQKFGVCDYPALVDCSSTATFVPSSPAQPIPNPMPPNPIPVQPIPNPTQPNPSPAQPSPNPAQPSPNPAQPSPDLAQPNPIPAEPIPSPVEPAPAQTPDTFPTIPFPLLPSQKPTFFPRPTRPGSIVNLPSIPDSLPSLQNILEGSFDRFPGGFQQPSQPPKENETPGFQFNPKLSDGNAVFMQNSIYNSHNFATPVAVMSPQDAIRYLKLNSLADLQSS